MFCCLVIYSIRATSSLKKKKSVSNKMLLEEYNMFGNGLKNILNWNNIRKKMKVNVIIVNFLSMSKDSHEILDSERPKVPC